MSDLYDQVWIQVKSQVWYEAWSLLFNHITTQVGSKICQEQWNGDYDEEWGLVRNQIAEDTDNDGC